MGEEAGRQWLLCGERERVHPIAGLLSRILLVHESSHEVSCVCLCARFIL